ncbi:16S rRNA processing protein RimM [bacterium]|nr:16S rRNA processing protein RimM [candidate division CSSED10-310 bacterium]
MNREKVIPDSFIAVGFIRKPHGNRGFVKVEIFSDQEDRLQRLNTVFLVKRGCVLGEYTISVCNSSAKEYIVKLNNIDSFDNAASISKSYLCVQYSERVKLGQWEFFFHDLIGCRVVTTRGVNVGIIKELWDIGPHDVYIVHDERGIETLIPAVKEIVKDVNVKKKLVVIDPYEGMLHQDLI